MKKSTMRTVAIAILAVVACVLATTTLIVWQAQVDAYPGAAWVPIPNTDRYLPENIQVSMRAIAVYILGLVAYFNLYTTGVDKDYLTGRNTAVPVSIGLASHMFAISYFKAHTDVSTNGLAVVCTLIVLSYFLTRMFGVDAEGVLDTRARNMVCAILVTTMCGFCVDQVYPLVFTLSIIGVCVLMFLTDAVYVLKQILTKS